VIATAPSNIYHIYIYAGDGDDSVTIEPSAGSVVPFVYGENGNDTLRAGNGSAYLDGGAGNDTLYGGAARNILVGGTGSDTLSGGKDEDMLIGGIFTYTEMLDATTAILNEWIRTDLTLAQRTSDIKAGTGLTMGFYIDSTVVLDDHVRDYLNGNQGNNWLLGSVLDITDLKKTDIWS
jgi:hypothetical protein